MQRATETGGKPEPEIWTREDAIEAFGVAYVHSGSWRDPIVEILGSRPPDPFSSTVCLPTEAAAVAHVRKAARADAEREVGRIDGYLDSGPVRVRLAMARSFRALRKREVGILATESILDSRRREFRDVLRNGLAPVVRRLPETIRMPVVLMAGCPVHVLDVRRFPVEPLKVRPDQIVRVHVSDEHAGAYDVTIRYEIGTVDGQLSIAAAGTGSAMVGTPAGVSVFLDAATAELQARAYAAGVVAKLHGGSAPLPDAPAAPRQEDVQDREPVAKADRPRDRDTHPRPEQATPRKAQSPAKDPIIPEAAPHEPSRSLVLVPASIERNAPDAPLALPPPAQPRKTAPSLAVVRPMPILLLPPPLSETQQNVNGPSEVPDPTPEPTDPREAVGHEPVVPATLEPPPAVVHAPEPIPTASEAIPSPARPDAVTAETTPPVRAPRLDERPQPPVEVAYDANWFPSVPVPTAQAVEDSAPEIVVEARTKSRAGKGKGLRGIVGKLMRRRSSRIDLPEPDPSEAAEGDAAPAPDASIQDEPVAAPRRTTRPTLPSLALDLPEATRQSNVSRDILSALEAALILPVPEPAQSPPTPDIPVSVPVAATTFGAAPAPRSPSPKVEEPARFEGPFPELRAFLASGGLVLTRDATAGDSLAVTLVEGLTSRTAVLDPPSSALDAASEGDIAAAA